LDLSNNNLDSFLKNIGGPEKGRFTLLGYPSKDKVFLSLPPYKNTCFEATIIQENENGGLRRQTPY
jgi:hypothetical protein